MPARDPYLGMNARERTQARIKDVRATQAANKAQMAAKSQEKQGGNTNANPKTGEETTLVYRYPKAALTDTTDYLRISIYDQVRTSDIFGLGNAVTETGTVDVTKVAKLPTANEAFDNPKKFAGKENYQKNFKKAKKNAVYIYLPIPQQITDALSVSYAEDTLNPLQAAGLNVAANPGQAAQDALALASQLFGGDLKLEGIDKATQNAIVQILGGKAINSLGANVTADALISRASGQILQSNLELLFSGVTLRTFPFIFDFAPRDQDEAEEVKNIIRALKIGMSAKKGSALFIGSPKIFQLEYMTGDKEHPFLNKFKICALTDISVNYTASGTYATYGDGTPVHIQVQCNFKELNPIYQEDYKEATTGVGY